MNEEWIIEKRNDILNEVLSQCYSIERIINHFDKTVDDFIFHMKEFMMDKKEEEPQLWSDWLEYRARLWESYDQAMGWMMEEEQITQGEDNE